MEKKLAIIGHSTRGKEVIELLEMMGGENKFDYHGECIMYSYYIGGHTILNDRLSIIKDDDFVIFNLEEFLEKYPFKVGDIVHIYVQNDDIDGRYDVEVAEIASMRWNPVRCKIAYKMKNINREFYKEEIKCKVDDNHTKPSKMKNVLAELLNHIKNTPKEELEREFNELEEWTNVGPTVEEFMDFCDKVNKNPVYPTTYEECCKILDIRWEKNYAQGYKCGLICKFQELYIARNAYWKIAGEQMGLGKPWEPDWEKEKYSIYRYENNKIVKGVDCARCINCHILEFPTEEMRDVFYENFNDLIEACKELL